jgi:NADH-quinone oxidoreductase subunit N
MTPIDLVPVLPLIAMALAALLVMLVAAFHRNHAIVAALTFAGLIVSLLALIATRSAQSRQVTPLLLLDNYAVFYIGLILAASAVVTLLSYGYWERRCGRPEEYYVLLLCATLGACVMTASTHFVSFFLGLEILSVPFYAMIAYPRTDSRSLEAAVKYLVLAAGSAAFLLFGMALVYAETGTMEFARIAAIGTLSSANTLVLLSGSAMMIAGIGFKLALVPFHWWTPDVYEGAPAPVTAFVATVSKGAMFALLLRYFTLVDAHAYPSLFLVFTIMAIASMFVGNLLALLQDNVKRILAYSSIAHLGYLLVAFLASGPLAGVAAAFYLVAYFITTLGTFGVITVLSTSDREADRMEDYRGLFWRRPWIAAAFTTMLLSLAGIPLTVGFIGKFYVLAAGEESQRWLLVLLLVVNSAIGLFYYLRIVVTMGSAEDADEGAGEAVATPSAIARTGIAALAGLTAALVWFGVYPAPLIALVQSLIK